MTEVEREKVETKSAADFFHDNKAIAGFDNSMRVVFTSVRELVENGLDAAEKIGILPEIKVKIEKLDVEEVARLLNISKESISKSKRLDFLKLTVRDNGSGVPPEDVPLFFGRVLTGSNYGARQTRGRFGLGAKMVLLNAMATVDLPITVISRHFGTSDVTSLHRLFIDLRKNEPIIETEMMFGSDSPNFLEETGTEVTVTFTGSWNLAKSYIKEYFSQLAIITPYATLDVELPGEGEGLQDDIFLERVVDEMPPYPKHSKIHAWGCDITQLKREISATRHDKASAFFLDHFSGFRGTKGRQGSLTFMEFVKIDPDKNPADFTSSEIRRVVHNGFRRAEKKTGKRKKKEDQIPVFPFSHPKGDSLSPLGDKRLEKGLMRELGITKEDDETNFIVSRSSTVMAYGGHPFVIEAALAYTGKMIDEKKSFKIYRYANRIPLLFGQGNDIITKVISDESEIDWKRYKVVQNTPLAIAVSLVSTKIPFPETSKEYIADVEEIRLAIRTVLNQLGTKLGTFLSKKAKRRRESERVSRFQRLAPQVIANLLPVISDREDLPFSLNHMRTLSVRALGENSPKEVPRKYPPSQPIFKLSLWLDEEIKRNLNKKGVISICDFLHHPPSSDVFKMKGGLLTKVRVEEVKRATITYLDLQIDSPRITTLELFDSDIEKGYDKVFPKTERALSKKWISTVYDFFASSIDTLMKIDGFFDKTLMQYKRDSIKYLKTTISETQVDHSLEGFQWFDDKINKDLTKNNIFNALDFITAFSEELYSGTSLVPVLLTRIKQEIQENDKIKSETISAVKDIKAFDWVSGKVRQDLSNAQITTWGDFFSATIEDLRKISSLRDTLIDDVKKEVVDSLKDRTGALDVTSLPFMTEALLRYFKQEKIMSLYDFLAYADFSTEKTSAVREIFIRMLKDRKLKKHNRSKNMSYVEHGVWIPNEYETYLLDKNIRTVFDFLSTPAIQIAGEGDVLSIERVKSIKMRLGTPLNYLSSEFTTSLDDNIGTVCSEELIGLTREDIPKDYKNSLWPKIKEIQDILDNPLCFLPGLASKKAIMLSRKGILKISDFLIWQPQDYTKNTSEITDYFLILNSFKIDELEKTIKAKTPLEGFGAINEDTILEIKAIGFDSIEDLYFTHIDDILAAIDEKWNKIKIHNILEFPNQNTSQSRVIAKHPAFSSSIKQGLKNKKAKGISQVGDFLTTPVEEIAGFIDLNDAEIELIKKQIIFENVVAIKKKIETPISSLKNLTFSQIKTLKNNGILTLIDLLIIQEETLEKIFPDGDLTLEEIKANLKDFHSGTPLKDLPFLDDAEIETLKNEKIYTIEELYFSQHKDTFGLLSYAQKGTKGMLRWERISELKRSMEMPVALLAFERDETKEQTGKINLSQEILTPNQISKLQSFGIEHIIDFYIARDNDIAPLLNVKATVVSGYKKRSILKEKGISISSVAGIGKKELRLLNTKGLESIEDLYFIAKEETFEDPDDWRWVSKFKKSLNVPLSFLSFIRPQIVAKLQEIEINTLIKLLMFQTYEIAEKIDANEEIIENMIERIKLSEISRLLSSSVSIIEEIPPEKYNVLRKNSIVDLGDFLSISDSDLAKLLGMTKKKIVAMKNSMKMDTIEKRLEESMIPVSGYYKLAKSVEKKLVSINLASIDSIYFFTDEDSLPDNKMKSIVNQIKKMLNLPITAVPGIKREKINDFTSVGVSKIADFLMWSNDTLAELIDCEEEKIAEIKDKLDLKSLQEKLAIPLSTIGLEKQLDEEEFATVLDFLSASNSVLAEKLEKKPSEIIKLKLGIDLNLLEDKLSIPLTYMYDLDVEAIRSLARRRIVNFGQFLSTEHQKIQEILSLSEDQYSDLVESCNFQMANESLNLTILILNIPGREKKELYSAEKDLRVRDLVMNSQRLSSLNILSKKRIKELSTELTYKNVQESKKQFNFSINSIYNMSELMEKHCSDSNINDILQLVMKEHEFQEEPLSADYNSFSSILNSPISYVDKIPSSKRNNLLNSGILTVLDFLYWDNTSLGKILEKSPEEVQSMKKDLKMSNFTEKRKQGTPLKSFKHIPEQTMTLLEENGFEYIEDLFMDAKVALIKEEEGRKEINQFKSLIISPVVFHTELSSAEKVQLIDAGINSLSEIIMGDRLDILNIEEEERKNEIKYNLDFTKLKNLREKRGIDMSFMSAFNQRTVERLKKNHPEIMTLEDIYYTLNTTNLPTTLINAVIAFKTSYEAPINTMTGLQPEKFALLGEKGFKSVSKFIMAKTSELVEILGLNEDQVRKVKYSQNFGNLRKKRKLGTPLAVYPGFDEVIVEKFKEKGITTIEEVYFHARKYLIIDITGEEVYNQFMKHMNSPVTTLDSIPISLGPVFKRNKLERVVEFLYWPLPVLRNITKLPYDELKLMKNELDFIDKKDMKKKIDSLLGL